jgi:hypothetical protein
MDTMKNDRPDSGEAARLLSDGELDAVAGAIIIIGGAEARGCSNNLREAVLAAMPSYG